MISNGAKVLQHYDDLLLKLVTLERTMIRITDSLNNKMLEFEKQLETVEERLLHKIERTNDTLDDIYNDIENGRVHK